MIYTILDDDALVGFEPWDVALLCAEVQQELKRQGRWPAHAVLRHSGMYGGVILEDGPWRDWALVADIRWAMLVRAVLL